MEDKDIARKSGAALREEAVLNFWKENKIFSKSLEKESPSGEFIFYDGPVTANSKPVLHTMVPFSFKDAIPRYKTMRGYHVRRKGGWDTHGLPVELQVEKKLNLDSKKAIEEYGIAKFNQECKESVWEYIGLWKDFTNRMGYWADQENPYVTYHNDYIESVWNVLKKVDEQKLLYKDYKVVPWCPRCGTTLSSHELAQGYEDVKDLSVYVKFKLRTDGNGVYAGSLSPRARGALPLGSSACETPRQKPISVGAYFLAWTTTPWTLPGNVALAVGKDIDYVEIKVKKENSDEILVLAKERLSVLDSLADPYEIIAEHKGAELVGMQYEPIFPFLKNLVPSILNLEPAYKVYDADFVTTLDGTGIVHIASMYGQDDFALGTKVGLPKYHLVGLDGKFLAGTGFLNGRFVKEKDVSTDGKPGKPTLDVDIIKYLTDKNLFFRKENYEHSYPHCWRCHTALIYYARDSWYIKVSDSKIKEKMIAENKEINWEPSYIREGRFGEWLREIKDWAISRERYWGTPLPVWQCASCKKIEVIGSISELKAKTKKSGNKYFVMRHGEAENNTTDLHYKDPYHKAHLTEKGKKQVSESAKKFYKKIDIVISSPFNRTKETTKITCEQIGFPLEKVIYDERIQEWETSSLFEGKDRAVFRQYYQVDYLNNPFEILPDGESFAQVVKRIGDFVYDLEKKYSGKNILIFGHDGAFRALSFVAQGLSFGDLSNTNNPLIYLQNAEIREFDFVPLPHNENYELDLHRPYIDEVKLVCTHSTGSGQACGGELIRTKEVMDVWFDSGCMPFAQDHYPFDNKKWVEGKGYPADFISEAIDQTRGWFYTLHAVGILMGRGKAFKNVICLGHLMDASGKKMSKSLGNIVDPWVMIEKYGVDTLRLWMYSVNQPGESKNFDEKTVALLHQQVFGLLYNVLAFYELYRDRSLEARSYNLKPNSILDQWILARLDELIKLSTENLDNYKLLEPVRGIKDFIGDLSTWYLRRSRERIKNGDKDAKQTLYFILKTLAKIFAPFAPFTAEDIWLKLKTKNDLESVHLTEWPKMSKRHFDIFSNRNDKILKNMQIVRNVVTLGLEARQKAGIKVRQPLAKLEIKNFDLRKEYIELIKDELNVREVLLEPRTSNLEPNVKLDTEITPELKAEGEYREFMRELQDQRKKMGLNPEDKMSLSIETIYKKYKIMPSLQNHMFRVTAVASLICDNFSEPLSKDDIITACLLHDMGNIIKFDLKCFPESNKPEGIEYWQKVKNDYVNKYGNDECEATRKIMKELNVSDKIIELVDQILFSHLCHYKDGNDFGIKIVNYSDGRVDPHGVVSYDERMDEAKKRYKNHKDMVDEEKRRHLVACGKEIEKQIFSKCKIKPEDINDESVKSVILELKIFVVK